LHRIARVAQLLSVTDGASVGECGLFDRVQAERGGTTECTDDTEGKGLFLRIWNGRASHADAAVVLEGFAEASEASEVASGEITQWRARRCDNKGGLFDLDLEEAQGGVPDGIALVSVREAGLDVADGLAGLVGCH
jgi:hypothetical protein